MRDRLLRPLALLCAMLFFTVSYAQRTISGTITDEKQDPIVGATVSVKGTLVATTTDGSGKFSIAVPANGKTLVVSYVGMQSKEIAIGSNNSVSVSLSSANNTLSDVVVVGYGQTSRRANLTVAQSTVSSKDIEKTVNTTIEQAIQGRAAGVTVTQNSGQPGGGMSINIRGISSINGATQPLFVIDGVQSQSSSDVSYGSSSSTNALAGLNPSDIDDIQILQGPSATALYGSRGTNGVVLITTKRGKSGDFKINYIYQYSQQQSPKHLPVMNLQQYAQMVKEYHTIAGGTTPSEFLDPSLLGNGTDWQHEIFNKAALKKHQLSFSGGSQNTTYYMSGEYFDQQGVAVGSGFKRYSFRLNLDNKPREWASIGANLSFNQTEENLTTTNYGDAASPLIANALRLTPQIPVVNINGSWGAPDSVNGAGQYAPVNPIALASLITNKNTRRQFQGGLNFAVMPLKGLSIRTSLNGNIGTGLANYYTPTYNLDKWHVNSTASLQTGSYQSWYWVWNQQIEYNRQFGKHNITVMATHEAQEGKYIALSAGRTGFLTNDILDVNAGDPKTATNGGGTYPNALESFLGRLNYNYDNRYLLTATIRRDGSPNFGANKRWGSFPSMSLAWRINKESFFNIPSVSDFKLRYELGLTGNPWYNTNAVYAAMNPYATPWGTGFLPAGFTNPEFQWESTKTNNFGINLGFLNNRFTLEADYYTRKADHLILGSIPLPWYMGSNGNGSVSPPPINSGVLTNKGWSFTINTVNIQNKTFRWESNLNLSHFKTTIDEIYQDKPFLSRTSWWMNNWTQRSIVGQAPWLMMGYIEEGLFQSVDEINKSAVPYVGGQRVATNATTGIWVGDVKYKDINGDGIIDDNDLTVIGNPWPKLTGGFSNSFSFKGFDLSILITGSFGNDVYNYIAAEASNPNNINLSRNLMVKALDYARVNTDANGKVSIANPDTRVPRISSDQFANDNNFAKITDRFLEDGSYVRLKNISLSYNVPANVLGYTHFMKGLRATIGVQNIYTWTKYKGYDPEVGAYIGTGADQNNQAIGIDFGRYPITPMYNASISVNF